jgi:hypothetical protein
MTFQATDVPGGITFTGTYTVVGGTGRFAAVTGDGVVAGSALLSGLTVASARLSLCGITFGPGD